MADKDFFLDPDDAQTLGDVNYMRRSVRVRRTFPKTLKNKDGFEVIKEVSANGNRNFSKFNGNGNGLADVTFQNPVSNNNGNGASTEANTNGNGTSSAESFKPNKTDTSMDMFRNMARNVGKK
jgi:hypothetical protein